MEQKKVEQEFNPLINRRHLFSVFDVYRYSKVKMLYTRKMHKEIKAENVIDAYAKILIEFFKIVVDDLMENGNIFVLPVASKMEFKVQEIASHRVKRIFQAGAYAFVDKRLSDFKLYNFVFKSKSVFAVAKLYKRLYKELVERVHNGKRYAAYRR